MKAGVVLDVTVRQIAPVFVPVNTPAALASRVEAWLGVPGIMAESAGYAMVVRDQPAVHPA
ncbi:MAG TPA: hypothetical protein VES20_11700 [Bryobacteraceae bacterium]|nr:hypothetical protein [Bryobacteraceae bacterium]